MSREKLLQQFPQEIGEKNDRGGMKRDEENGVEEDEAHSPGFGQIADIKKKRRGENGMKIPRCQIKQIRRQGRRRRRQEGEGQRIRKAAQLHPDDA